MNLNIDLLTSYCKLIIKDITEVSDLGGGYLSESSSATYTNRFKYSDTVSIHVFIYNNTKEELISTICHVVPHDLLSLPFIKYFEKDGYVSYYYIVIPTKLWVDNNREEALTYTGGLYYSDGINIYKKVNNEEILLDNIDEILNLTDFDITTVSKIYSDLVIVDKIRDCYIEHCKKILNSKIKCYNKLNNKEILYKRDLLWMTLNVIDFLSEKGRFYEILNIIELIYRCSGLCLLNYNNYETYGDCGCS